MSNRKRVLIVEDEYIIAQDVAYDLGSIGVDVVGPVPSVERALRLIEQEPELDAALLDINLNGQMVFPVVDVLQARGVHVAFATGYDQQAIPARYSDVPRFEKPFTTQTLRRALSTK